MPVLSDTDRADIAADLMRELSRDNEPCAALKAEVRALVDATDQWQNDNAAAYNAALPAGARAKFTAAQKSRLFRAVSKKRYEKGA